MQSIAFILSHDCQKKLFILYPPYIGPDSKLICQGQSVLTLLFGHHKNILSPDARTIKSCLALVV